MTGYPGSEDIERRIDAVYEPAERLGAFLPLERKVKVGPHTVHVVATLADCTTTAILYRSPREAMIHPDVIAPGEAAGSAHGTSWRDLHVHHFGPVQPHRNSIAVTFVSRSIDMPDELLSSEPVILPIDRSRTAPHERFFADRPDAVVPGVRVRMLGGAVGVTSAVVEVMVESTDPDVLVLDLGGHHFGGLMRHVGRGPGPAAFWREWHPEPIDPPARPFSGPGGRMTISAAASMRLTAHKVATGSNDVVRRDDEPEPQPLRREPWAARAFPEGGDLPTQGSSSGFGRSIRDTSHSAALSFGVPPRSSTAVEIMFDGIMLFHFGSATTVTVPGPRADSTIDLGDHAFAWGNGRIDLVSWRSRMEGGWMTHRLTVRPSQPGWQPDIRILADDASVSAWLHPMTDGTHRGGLPAMYNPVMERSEVSLGLRMVGVPSAPVRLSVPLTPAGPA